MFINYDTHSYGSLINICIQEGLSLCNDIKLKAQLKKQKLTKKSQLGDFCDQFGFDNPKPLKDKSKLSRSKFKSKKKTRHVSQPDIIPPPRSSKLSSRKKSTSKISKK